ncbi:MAG: aldehyde ferredoxin oxidoreductase family protein [Sphaerochaetaceae bacterium]|nr:aldehyde ferredoxin oxidoreductase family protein [Sphaerochaetaceae bacterium]
MRSSYQGRVLNVDLTTSKIWVHLLEESYVRDYLGGRGAAAKMLWDMTGPDTKPLSKDNVIIFSPGVLTGTSAPTTGRTNVTFKSPATGGYFKSSIGGALGVAIKYAGYDHVVIRGKAKKPVYLYVSPTKVELCDASGIWGKDVKETNRLIKEQKQESELKIACIGRAGEIKSNFAAVMGTYYYAAARGGGGAVMGSKNLKALAFSTNGGSVYVADNDLFVKAAQHARDASLADSHSRTMKRFGTAATTDQMCVAGLLPTYNFSRQWLESGEENLTGQHLIDEGYLKRSSSCGTCIFGCHRYTKIDTGKFAGTYSEGPEYETFASLGANIGLTDSRYILKGNEMANDYGFDTISLGSAVSFAIESFEKGVITLKDTEGFELKWGDGETLLYLIDMIVQERGIGKLLAKGVKVASDTLGKDSYKWAVQARGLDQSRVELRGAFSYALAFAINPRGPDHLMTECLAEFGSGFSKHAVDVIKKITGDEKYAFPYLEEKRAEIVSWHEDIYAVSDSLGYCAFATTAAYGVDEQVCADTFNSAVGQNLTAQQIMEAGRRIVTLERCYNLREGWSRRCDVLPWRIMNEKAVDLSPKQPVEAVMDEKRLGRMLDAYYRLNGWDPVNGFPLPDTLEKLGLGYVESHLGQKRAHAMTAELPQSCRLPSAT